MVHDVSQISKSCACWPISVSLCVPLRPGSSCKCWNPGQVLYVSFKVSKRTFLRCNFQRCYQCYFCIHLVCTKLNFLKSREPGSVLPFDRVRGPRVEFWDTTNGQQMINNSVSYWLGSKKWFQICFDSFGTPGEIFFKQQILELSQNLFVNLCSTSEGESHVQWSIAVSIPKAKVLCVYGINCSSLGPNHYIFHHNWWCGSTTWIFSDTKIVWVFFLFLFDSHIVHVKEQQKY